MYTIRDMTDYECMHSACCDVEDPDNVECSTNESREPANLACLDKSNLKKYMACFSKNEVDLKTSLNSKWPQEVCSVFGRADKCQVDYPVDPCPADVCELEKCNDPEDSFVCYQVDPMGNAIGSGDNWGCFKNKPQKASACSSRYGGKLCDLSKCGGDYPGQDDCYGRGRCVRFNEEGCTACSCGEDGYVGWFCDVCAGGYSCIENGDIVDSQQCLPPNECKYTGGRCNNRGTPVGRNGPCSCPPGGKRYSGFDCQICNSGICYNPITKQVKHDAKYNDMNCPYPYVCHDLAGTTDT